MKIIDLNEVQLEYVENQLSAFDEKIPGSIGPRLQGWNFLLRCITLNSI